MRTFTLTVGSNLRFNENLYKITNKLNETTFELANLRNNQVQYVDQSEINIAYRQGQVEFLDDDEINLLSTHITPPEPDFASYSEIEKKRASKKLTYIEALEINEGLLVTIADKQNLIIETARTIKDSQPPKTWATIQRWKKQYDTSGRDIVSLVGETRKRGNRKKRFDKPTEELIEKAVSFYLTKRRPSIKSAYKRLCYFEWEKKQITGTPTPLPSYDGFRKRIKSLDKHHVMSKRYSKRVADSRFKAYTGSYVATRPLEVVEIDHTPLDLMVVDEESRLPLGRPTLTSIIDKFSRMVTGFYLSFTPPSTLSVIECLRHAILPKDGLKELYPKITNDWPAQGIPETINVDNGKEFMSKDFTEITRSLGINIIRGPVRTPTYKASVERHFRAVADQLLVDKPGKTFSNIVDKHEFDPSKDAIISLSAVVEITHLWIVDQVNGLPNDSINTTPKHKWESAISEYPARLPKNLSTFNIALGKIAFRKIQHYGIDFECLKYNSEHLSMIRRKHSSKVTIKYDPSDISKIYVLDPHSSEYITVPCYNYPYNGIKTEYQHRIIKRFARKMNKNLDTDTLMWAEKHIIEIVERETNLTKKIKRAQNQGRYNNVSQATKNHQSLPHQENNAEYLDRLSLFEDDSFDPYSDINAEEKSVEQNLLANDTDDELDRLYADDPDWYADYSKKDD